MRYIQEMKLTDAGKNERLGQNIMSKKILIIGGVAGGASAAARLRRLDENARIIMFERGDYISFANCGLPYYVGKVIEQRSELLLQTPKQFKSRFNVDVRVKHEVIAIDRSAKQVQVKDLEGNLTYTESYDKLVLSPGAEPLRPPIPGIDSDRVFTLRNVPDSDRINEFIEQNKPKRAVVIGAGFIGLEMAENLRKRGLLVAVVEMADQLIPPMDKEMTSFLPDQLNEHNIALWLNDGVAGFRQSSSRLMVRLQSGMELACDMAILSIGVRPESQLAQQAGLEMGLRNSIKINEYLQTSDPDIYAIGDAVEVQHFILGKPCLMPLAGPANRQGRMVADNICGRNVKYNGVQGTAILKVFELTAAMTGVTEKALADTDIAYEKLYLHPAQHVGYYPGAKMMHIKVIFTKPEGRLLGAQIVGPEGVDKNIDIFATAVRAGMTVYDLQELELAYAPPYGSGKNPVNMAGYAAANILDGTIDVKHFSALKPDDFILDVRTPREYERGHVTGAENIYVNQLRYRLDELDKSKTIHAYCTVGIRSYIACRILKQHGFDVRNLSGGYVTWLATESDELYEAQTAQQLREEFCTGL